MLDYFRIVLPQTFAGFRLNRADHVVEPVELQNAIDDQRPAGERSVTRQIEAPINADLLNIFVVNLSQRARPLLRVITSVC